MAYFIKLQKVGILSHDGGKERKQMNYIDHPLIDTIFEIFCKSSKHIWSKLLSYFVLMKQDVKMKNFSKLQKNWNFVASS